MAISLGVILLGVGKGIEALKASLATITGPIAIIAGGGGIDRIGYGGEGRGGIAWAVMVVVITRHHPALTTPANFHQVNRHTD